MAIRGSCLCGGVAFEMTGEPRAATHCHCSRCRKVRGTSHATNLVTDLGGVRFVRGEELLTKYKHEDARFFGHTFCRVCGSSMPRVDEGRGIIIVPMGAFDEDPGIRPARHIWVDARAAWDVVDDALEKFPGAPPALFPPTK